MIYSKPLMCGTFIRRYKRFFVEVQTLAGKTLTLHCPNTGSMKNCMVEGSPCWYSLSDKIDRKLPGTLELVTTSAGNLAGVNTIHANKIVLEAISDGRIEPLSCYSKIYKEVRYGDENSRIDLLLEGANQSCFVEVKNVTLDMGNGLALFPDSVTSRGSKHLRELIRIVASGRRAVLFFCVQLSGVDRLGVASDIDSEYSKNLHQAIESGVEVMAWKCELSSSSVRISRPIKFLYDTVKSQM